jgi:TrmH family RNA methyltransferase
LEVTSTANPRVKELLSLRRRRVREQLGLTLIEGYEELTLALGAGLRPRTLYYCPDLVADESQLRIVDRAAAQGVEVARLSRPVFEKVAYREGPDGFLAVAPAIVSSLADLSPGPSPLLLVCEAVEKPGNLGAMLRTADAAGLTAVIAADPVTDWGNPNVVRASKGTVFTAPVAAADSAATLRWLLDRSITIVATTPDTDLSFTDVDFTGPTAVAVGSEKYGLSESWLKQAHVRARIPMFGHVNSLNVATSAAIVVYEAVRQRGRR